MKKSRLIHNRFRNKYDKTVRRSRKFWPKEEDLVVEKVPLTNMKLKNVTSYELTVNNYIPDREIKEIIAETFDKVSKYLDIEDIDEIRKIYFLYYKYHVEKIKKYEFVKVMIPHIGFINPSIPELCKYINRLSKGSTHKTLTKWESIDLYNHLILYLKEIIVDMEAFYEENQAKEKTKYDFDFLIKQNRKWKMNYYKRNIKFHEVPLTNKGLFF